MLTAPIIASLLFNMQVMASAERQQFARCLRAFVDAKLEERVTPQAFEPAIAVACDQQEATYRAAYVAAATRAGDSRAVAERDARTEVEDLRSNFTELFHSAQRE
jgi:hypothetical protein